MPTSSNIVSSLIEHMKSKKQTTATFENSHDMIVLRSGTVRRPNNPTDDKC